MATKSSPPTPKTARPDPRPKRVTNLWVHQDTVVDLNIDGQRLTTTEDHPFWNATDQQWQQAQTLDPGDLLLTPDGTTTPVGGLQWSTAHIEAAYNLTVADIHTYYVLAGSTPVLVHNSNGPCGIPTPKITNRGLEHSFDRHAGQWFGRDVTKTEKLGEWNALIERAAGSSKVVPWSSGSTLTNAHIARIDGKYFVAQFDRSSGDLVTAFVPDNDQLGAMLSLLGK